MIGFYRTSFISHVLVPLTALICITLGGWTHTGGLLCVPAQMASVDKKSDRMFHPADAVGGPGKGREAVFLSVALKIFYIFVCVVSL